MKDFFSKCDQIRGEQRIWSHVLKKSFMENFIFCSVYTLLKKQNFCIEPVVSLFMHCDNFNVTATLTHGLVVEILKMPKYKSSRSKFHKGLKPENMMLCVMMLQPAALLKVTLLHGCFSCFSDCTNGAKSRKVSQMMISKEKLFIAASPDCQVTCK